MLGQGMIDAQWHIMNNAEQVAHAAVHRIQLKAQEAISHRGVFKMVLAGGTTPKRVYELLAEHHQQWSQWQLYIGDERCLDINDPERNSVMISQTWLDKIHFPRENFYPINAELGPEAAAKDYAQVIDSALPFDLVLLGMGEDGHTASLFPRHQYSDNERVHAVYNAPKAPSERVSLSKLSLSNSEQVMILITGSNKQAAIRQWQQGEELPINQIQSMHHLDILIDSDAMAQNK